MADEPIYVSPNAIGNGSFTNPTNLDRALESGRSMVLTGGVYRCDAISLASGKTMQGENNSRPVITRTDGKPPEIVLGSNSVLDGIWFGGSKETVTERAIQMGDGARIENCVFFGYYGGIAEGDSTNHIIQENLFVNCGTSPYYHDIYISKNHSVGGCIVRKNIHLGGGGYKHHLYNSENGEYPSNVIMEGNFYAGVEYAQAVYGRGHVIEKNILWSTVNITSNMQIGATYEWRRNVLGLNTARMAYYDESPDRVIDENFIVDGSPSEEAGDPIGNNLSVWSEGTLTENLGKTSAEINDAVSALMVSLGENVEVIYADETIDGNANTLRGVLNVWSI